MPCSTVTVTTVSPAGVESPVMEDEVTPLVVLMVTVSPVVVAVAAIFTVAVFVSIVAVKSSGDAVSATKLVTAVPPNVKVCKVGVVDGTGPRVINTV